ncbi:synaptic vesicle glycoprotein 2B-like isoform X1 [Apis laboriosa]|uniref:synaptic vesicle glycoprotein 2B-like isoform X1 n=1 Tax=Apis laboriosa TaxID=183418 RepID=UPI001CC4EE37|nr:synaptic vesicle glycoprotein 2B-like isoform X1 [Apis laboriosa]
MSNERTISIVTLPDKPTEENKIDSTTDIENKTKKSANFERAITAAGYGKFQYFLLLSIIPVSWSTSLNTSSVGIILPSAECDLQITFYQKGVLTAIVYVGMVCSGPLWGYIADIKGRRTVFLFGYLADGICNILSGLSQNFWMLLFFKFLSGFIISGPHASIVAYSSEFYGDKGRGKIPLLIGFSITLGNIVSSALALIIIPQKWSIVLWDGAFVYNSWRFFLSACSIPILIGVVCLFMFPESPKFLMSQDRMDDALKVFQRIYSINTGKPEEEYPIQYLQNDPPSTEESSNADHDGNMKKKAIFTNPYLSRLFSVIVMQFGSMFATNTFRLWQPQLFTILENFDPLNYNLTAEHESTFCEILDFSTSLSASENTVENATCKNIVVNESVYVNTIIISTLGSFFLLSSSFILNYLRYKILLVICYGISLICIISLYWSSNSLLTLLLSSFFIGFTNNTQNIIISATVIMFPTSLRTIAVSFVMMVGRIGSICGNILFPILLAQGCFVPMIQLACFILFCSILTCYLPLSKKGAKK